MRYCLWFNLIHKKPNKARETQRSLFKQIGLGVYHSSVIGLCCSLSEVGSWCFPRKIVLNACSIHIELHHWRFPQNLQKLLIVTLGTT